MDKLTPEQRRKSMQNNKSAGTKIESILGKAMFARGLRYRKNNKKVFGTPDFTFKKYRIAIFADGDFWHGKDWEIRRKKLGANAGYWFDKIERNLERDFKVNKKLKETGWTVLRFWESDIKKDLLNCVQIIEEKMEEAKMNLKEKIALKEIDHKKINIPNTEAEAVLTHYLQNKNKNSSKNLKKEAVKYTREILQYKYPDEKVSLQVAEDALEYGIFNKDKVPFPPHENPKFTFIDLFAGIGGFRLALQNLGGECAYSSEWNVDAKKTYHANFGETPFGDITQDEVKSYIPVKFDILCGGFPCQAFSIAGYRKGFSDTRGTLFFDIEQIVEKHRPKVIFLENVKNLVSHDGGKTFKVILDVLENKMGYKAFHKVLNSMDYANIPQNRERIFIVAFDEKQVPNFDKFEFPKNIKLSKTIHDILEVGKQEEKYYYKKEHKYYPELEKTMTKNDTVYQWRRIYVRENKSNVCPTLTANMGAGGHNVPLIKDLFGIRKLTPRECFSFQGYPENFKLPEIADSKLYMQAGNSVTMPLIQRIAEKIVSVL